ncbi:intermembrane transport protein PqiB [Rhodoferax sp.]|uniref:PqiB family protein n=1 Tax=Rhodoferax sp. TaxID=50421 RepID=UPI00374D0F60
MSPPPLPDAPQTPPPELPKPAVEQSRSWLPSLIWLIPIIAALVGITLVVKTVLGRGPTIEISFRTAEGLEAGKTKVKYKEVDIGTVTAIRLAEDRSRILATVRLQKEARSFTADDTRFWVIRPRLEAAGVSGLGTLLSGAYIRADAGVSEETSSDFTGLETAPIVTRDATGRQFTLHASNVGSLDIGSPLFFRRIQVGQVASYELDPDGKGVTLRVFVNQPYAKFVGANTRFWHASGIDVEANASGFKLRTQSLATVVLGGIALAAPNDEPGNEAAENSKFTLSDDETTAMKAPDGPSQTVQLYFNQSLRGLTPGAAVDFRGVVIGEVKSIGVEFDKAGRDFRMPVVIEVFPDRMRRPNEASTPTESFAVQRQRIQFLISKGLRAQLRTGNLLTGQLFVALDFFPKAPPVTMVASKASEPLELPTLPNGLDELQTQVSEIVAKINKVPFEQISTDLRKTLATLDSTLGSAEQLVKKLNNDVAPEVTAAMQDLRKTINTANQTLDAAGRTLSEDAPLQQDLRQTLREVNRAAASTKVLTDYLERHPESLLRGKPEEKK